MSINRKHLAKINEIFINETFPFGLSETGIPRIKWMYSEDDVHPMRVRNEDGSLKFNYRCQCGLNKRPKAESPEEHKESCSGTVIAEPVYVMRRVLDFHGYANRDGSPIRRQVVLWKWGPAPPKATWDILFGSQLDYEAYRKGVYEPVAAGMTKRAAPDGSMDPVPITICIENQDELPTVETTWLIIRKFRERLDGGSILKPVKPTGMEFAGIDHFGHVITRPTGQAKEDADAMVDMLNAAAKPDPKRIYSLPEFAPLIR